MSVVGKGKPVELTGKSREILGPMCSTGGFLAQNVRNMKNIPREAHWELL
jgi:hypothetical protein